LHYIALNGRMVDESQIGNYLEGIFRDSIGMPSLNFCEVNSGKPEKFSQNNQCKFETG
jgi:hypothetical protein